MSAFSINSAFAAVDENGCYVPDSSVETNRYYFAMPQDWYNENTDTAGVYWWPSNVLPVPDQDVLTWPGYKANKGDFSNVYYVDCPTDITGICWNNFIDGGNDIEDPVYYQGKSSDIYSEFCTLIDDSDIYDEEWFAETEESYKGDKTALRSFAENFFYDEQFGFFLISII